MFYYLEQLGDQVKTTVTCPSARERGADLLQFQRHDQAELDIPASWLLRRPEIARAANQIILVV